MAAGLKLVVRSATCSSVADVVNMLRSNGSTSAHGGATRVCLVDDHHVVRNGLAMVLERSGFDVVGSVGTAAEAFDVIALSRPDVGIVDLMLPDESGRSLIRRMLAQQPGLRVLLYTGSGDPEEIAGALESGAHGLVAKSSDPAKFGRAVATVRDGGAFIDEALKPALVGIRNAPALLTRREAEILELLAVGLSGEQVAEHLVLSSETVRTHVRNSSTKLGARTRAHALVLALQSGEIRP